jgi:hypothetical protein
MKTKLAAALLLTAICLLLVTAGTGTGHAQPPQPTYAAYLPLVARPCITKTSAYASASSPLIHVGDMLTVTGVIVNECSRLVGQPYFSVYPSPQGILSRTELGVTGYYAVPIGEYRELTLTLQAVGTGQVTIASGMLYETLNDDVPPGYYWDSVAASPIVVRVMPNLP